MGDRKQLTIWVSESQKENWDQYKEELGFQNRSDMVRRAVEYYYRDKTSDDGLSEEIEDSINTLTGNVLDELDSLDRRLESIEASLKNDPQLSILMGDIYDYLPEVTQAKVRELSMEGSAENWHDSHHACTPDELANEFDSNTRVIIRACEALRVERNVRVHEQDGKRYYYREAVERA